MTSLCAAAALAFPCVLWMYILRRGRPLRFPYAGVLLLFFRVFPFLIPGGWQAERAALPGISVFVFLKQWKKELPAICILCGGTPGLGVRKIRSRYPPAYPGIRMAGTQGSLRHRPES